MSKSVDLADAIAEHLNDKETNDFTFAFQAQRTAAALTEKDLRNLKTVKVLVFTGPKSIERQSRGKWLRTFKPIVAVVRPLDGQEQNTVDELEGLIEEIEAALENFNIEFDDDTVLSFVSFDEELDREPYDPGILRDLKVFATFIQLEYVGTWDGGQPSSS